MGNTSSVLDSAREYNKYTFREAQCVAGGRRGGGPNELNGPTKLAIDDDQDLYVVDTRNERIIRVQEDVDGSRVDVWCTSRSPTGVCAKGGQIYVAGSMGDVSAHDPKGGSSTILSSGCGFNFQGIAVDENNCHIVADVDKAKVLRLSPNGRSKFPRVETVAGGLKGKGKEQFQCPWDVTVADGVVYVCDMSNDRVMRWVPGAERGEVVAGGCGEGSRPDQLNSPCALCTDPNGDLFVADYGNNRVLRVSKGCTPEVVVEVKSPTGVAVNDAFELFVSSGTDHAVYKFAPQ
jgi:sugar lactone lactonase YvrE